MSTRRRMVFVGAGHAHLHALKRCRAFVERGHDCVLVAPGKFWYSGLATGVIGGQYPVELDQIDAAALVERAGGRFIRDRVVGLDAAARTLELAKGGTLEFDVASLNIGSRTPAIDGEDRHAEFCFAAKPIQRLCKLRDQLIARAGHGGRHPRIVVAGSGPTAFELAANVIGLGERLGACFDVTVVAGGERMLRQLPRAAAGAVVAGLKQRGLLLLGDRKVVRVIDHGVVTDRDETLECDFFINATGLRPAALACDAGLPCDDDGAMIVDEHLRSTADPAIFGGGDFIRTAGSRIDKVGVHAIRQAPVLFRNALAAIDGRAPDRSFRPQARYLWIMNLGDGSGLAARGRLWFRGRAAFWLKDWIDRRFLRSNRV